MFGLAIITAFTSRNTLDQGSHEDDESSITPLALYSVQWCWKGDDNNNNNSNNNESTSTAPVHVKHAQLR